MTHDIRPGSSFGQRPTGRKRGARRVGRKTRIRKQDHQLDLDFGTTRENSISNKKPTRSKKCSGTPHRFLKLHWMAWLVAVRKLRASCSSFLITIVVLGIVLSLPTGFYLLVKNVKIGAQGWSDLTQINLYLKRDLPEPRIQSFVQELQASQRFDSVKFVSAKEGLREFQQHAGLGNLLTHLKKNPIPATIILTPYASQASEDILDEMLESFRMRPEVLEARLDFQWVRRFWAGLHLAETAVWMVSILFVCTAVFVMGNTIRLLIEDQRREIELIKLIGGTHRYIRRPYLYMGAIMGLLAGVIALLLIGLMKMVLQQPLGEFLLQFQSLFELQFLDAEESIVLLLVGLFLGLTGTWMVTTWHLRRIHPD
ncbi:MAG: ABC transporter permease [Gammaproteobacteria bacterium]|nr:MAG: ABC transporter permease [Gammaproteobacteria bacterium]